MSSFHHNPFHHNPFAPSTKVVKHHHYYHDPSLQQSTTSSKSDTVTFDTLYKIVIVLDESGSMGSIKQDMLKSINDLIREQKQVRGRPTTFTLVKFNDKINRVIKNASLNDVKELSIEDYSPSGSTALYDGICDTIKWFRNEKNVLMIIVTDGMENASKTYNKRQLVSMIDEKKKNNEWTYVYLSNDLSTFEQGNNMGLKSSSFASNCVLEQKSYGNFMSNTLNSAISNFRTNGVSVQSQLNR